MRRSFACVLIVAAVMVSGCTKSDMDSQPKYHEYEKAGLFADGKVLQTPPDGSVARDDLAREADAAQKPEVDLALLQRGRARYDIFCSPCHDRTGSGNGIVVQRGMPQPPSYHDPRLRAAPDRHFFDVISGGYGAMYSYAARVPPRDRWAIVAYIRALQLSQHAALSDVPDAQRAALGAAP